MSRRPLLLTAGVLIASIGVMLLASLASSDKESLLAQTAKQKPKAKSQKPNAKRSKQAPPLPPPPSAEEAGVPVLSEGDSYDDFASIAQAADGTAYVAYAAYYDAHDQIRLHKRFPGGGWSTRTHVPLVEARSDIWMPQLAVDSKDRLWVIWCEQTDRTRTESGNWDLYARAMDGDTWGKIVRLSNDPKPDINPHVAVDADRNIHVVWQAHPDNTGDVMYSRFDGRRWSKALAVTSGSASDWYPQVAVDAKGTAWIAFDSYRNGDYDVFLTSVQSGKSGKVIPIATSKYYEAHASVSCTPGGRVWIAWEEGGYNWGKDQGYWIAPSRRPGLHPEGGGSGSTLGSSRTVRVAAYKDGKVWIAPDLPAVQGSLDTKAMAALATDSTGRLWLRFRRMNQKLQGKQRRGKRYWTENVTYLTAGGWAKETVLPASEGRISVFSRILPATEGGLLVAYSSDQRAPGNYHQPIHDRVLVATLPEPVEPAGYPELSRYQPPEAPKGAKTWDVATEERQVTAARRHRAANDGESLRIVRGDLHRHTELSWDVGPGNDGSYLDFYRYMIDVAAMDFGGLTDHQGGGHYAYHWWLTEKSADMYYLTPRFVPLYGYERSAKFPNGHRNIFHSYRGVPVFAFRTKTSLASNFPGVGSGDLVENDTKLLYEYLHGSGGVAISHTSGTSSMGTDWRDNDPEIEPVVEIYQGCRNSYEVVGGPRVHDADKYPSSKAPGGYQEAGLIWVALAKGYRMGTIASSDHSSTHISYAMVYTPANKRQEILDAIRKRHTYGSTDNIIVEFRANGHFMGDEFTTSELPSLELKVQGTGEIDRIDLVRNQNYIWSKPPDKEDAEELTYIDTKPQPGLNYYYFRILQKDGQVAWSSPIWVNYQAK